MIVCQREATLTNNVLSNTYTGRYTVTKGKGDASGRSGGGGRRERERETNRSTPETTMTSQGRRRCRLRISTCIAADIRTRWNGQAHAHMEVYIHAHNMHNMHTTTPISCSYVSAALHVLEPSTRRHHPDLSARLCRSTPPPQARQQSREYCQHRIPRPDHHHCSSTTGSF